MMQEEADSLAAMLRKLADMVESEPPLRFHTNVQMREAAATPDYERGWWKYESRGLGSARVEITWRP